MIMRIYQLVPQSEVVVEEEEVVYFKVVVHQVMLVFIHVLCAIDHLQVIVSNSMKQHA